MFNIQYKISVPAGKWHFMSEKYCRQSWRDFIGQYSIKPATMKKKNFCNFQLAEKVSTEISVELLHEKYCFGFEAFRDKLRNMTKFLHFLKQYQQTSNVLHIKKVCINALEIFLLWKSCRGSSISFYALRLFDFWVKHWMSWVFPFRISNVFESQL